MIFPVSVRHHQRVRRGRLAVFTLLALHGCGDNLPGDSATDTASMDSGAAETSTESGAASTHGTGGDTNSAQTSGGASDSESSSSTTSATTNTTTADATTTDATTTGEDSQTSTATTGPGPICGDGTVQPAEQCDDGNDIDDDGCKNDCTFGEGVICGSLDKIIPTDGATGDRFGSGLAAQGDTIVVGASHHNEVRGAAYVCEKYEEGWVLTAKLTASDGHEYDSFGYSVAIDGDVIVVGAVGNNDNPGPDGSAYVFTKNNDEWTQQETQKLVASDGNPLDNFGISVAIQGDVIVVGAKNHQDMMTDSGSAYIFEKQGDQWHEILELYPSDPWQGNSFGTSVAIDEDVIVVGGPTANGLNAYSGGAYIYEKEGDTWPQLETAKVIADDGLTHDHFGWSVAVDGTTIAVGAQSADGGMAENCGAAYVFEKQGEPWVQTAKLQAATPGTSGNAGTTVVVRGDIIVAGATGSRNEEMMNIVTGAAYVFHKQGDMWPSTETSKLLAPDSNEFDALGRGLAITDANVIVGAWQAEEDVPDSGAVYICPL